MTPQPPGGVGTPRDEQETALGSGDARGEAGRRVGPWGRGSTSPTQGESAATEPCGGPAPTRCNSGGMTQVDTRAASVFRDGTNITRRRAESTKVNGRKWWWSASLDRSLFTQAG